MSEFDDFFELIKGTAAAMFKDKGEHMPMFYCQNAAKELVLMPAAWADVADKQHKCIAIRAALELGIFDRCCLVHEMWFAEDANQQGMVDASKVVPPSQRADRRKMLMILGVDREQHRFGHWEIVRKGSRKPTLSEYQLRDNMVMMSAAFRGLVPDEGTQH